jgi:replicative DNA helicase
MSIDELLMRLFSYESKVPMKQIQTGRLNNKEMVLLGHACKTLKMHNIYFDESNSSDIYDIRAKCRQLKQTGRLDMVVIDYLQLITSSDSRGNRQEEVARISRSLKILAQELEVPVIALSQLSRQAETREDNRPGLADLRESGSIEQDADVVMFLYRKAKKKKKEGEEEAKEVIVEVEQVTENEESSEQILNLYVAKNRQGALRDLPYVFTPAICHFQESKYITKTEDN